MNNEIKQYKTEQKQVERKHQKKNKLRIHVVAVTKAQYIHGNEAVTKMTTLRRTVVAAAYSFNHLIAT
jgi:hypothetical protein